MSILYYPNRVYRAKVPAIDRVMAKRQPITAGGSQNVASTALSAVISNDTDWQVESIGWNFSNTASRDFNAYIMRGRKIVEHLNDYLWFQINTGAPQRIILTPDFYTGTELATELQTRLNAATLLDGSVNGFSAAGITFTVTYNAATGRYLIVPSAGTVRYLNVNTRQGLTTRDSIAGHLFGLNADTALAANVSSDTVVFGLDTEVAFVSQTANDDLSYYHNDIHTLTVDQALHLTSNSGSDVTIDYVVDYESIV
jgi:hypothetical protein